MKHNPLLELQTLGQSAWMDFIRRGMLASGELKHLLDEDGVSGVTSNLSIFEKAIFKSRDHDATIHSLTNPGRENCGRDLPVPYGGRYPIYGKA